MLTEKIDYSKEYKIEAVPSKNQKELAEHGLSTYPGITQYVSAQWNDMLKKYEGTGFDENAPHILRLDSKERGEIQKFIVAKRKELEDKAGLPEGYLKATSEAWSSDLCIHHIEVGQDLKIRVNGHDNILRPAENYKDAILLTLIMNSKSFPKGKKDSSSPDYRDARFYLTTTEEQSNITKGSLQKKKKAYVYLNELFEEGKQTQKAWEVAFKLGLVNKQKVDADTLELKLHEAIFNDKSGKTLDAFNEACELSKDMLIAHNLFQQAINLGLIRVSPDGFYHRGAINYRKTKQESVDYLLTPGNELELAELKSDVETRKKKHNAIG